jgi:MarR family 2-MHQ and catechol resistance regulon transcriptional repressor
MGSRYPGREDTVRALSAFINLVRAAESVSGRIMIASPAGSKAGLTPSQFGALECLYHCGPMCQKTLAEKILRSGSNMTTVVDNLEKRGLVQRDPDPEDRRYFSVRLTGKGRQLIARVMPRHVEAVVREMSSLTGTELDALRGLCRKLGKKEGRREKSGERMMERGARTIKTRRLS